MGIRFGYRRGVIETGASPSGAVERELTTHHLFVDVDGDGSSQDLAGIAILRASLDQLAGLAAAFEDDQKG